MRKKFELPVLFEDQDVLAVNKPHGVVVNRSQSYADQTVQDWMEEHLAGKEWAEGWQIWLAQISIPNMVLRKKFLQTG